MWWSLYCYDKQANFAFGRPYIIHDAHVDVREPANADTSLIDEDGTDDIVSLPVDMPTPFSEQVRCIPLVGGAPLTTRRHSRGYP